MPLPYAPNRITPASSVLVPITMREWELSRLSANPLRKTQRPKVPMPVGGEASGASEIPRAAQTLPSDPASKKRSAVEDSIDDTLPDDSGSTRALEEEQGQDAVRKRQKMDEDKLLVAQYYNARPNVDRESRQESPIIGLKNFNNWVKSVLIAKYARQAPAFNNGDRHNGGRGGRQPPMIKGTGIKVLDLGCGKGGDLAKWSKAGTEEYIGIDLAAISIEQARSRYNSMRMPFEANFYTLDAYERPLTDILRAETQLARPFDVVSMQFCMHYAFETETKARTMLKNVSTWLRPGGVVIGTIPNSDKLLDEVYAVPPEEQSISFGNSIYRVEFDERDLTPRFGHRYSFFLKDAVEEVPEYVVHWAEFVELAREYDLEVIFEAEFHSIFIAEQEVPEFAELLIRMRVLDANQQTQMDADQFETTNLYKGFVLQKRIKSGS